MHQLQPLILLPIRRFSFVARPARAAVAAETTALAVATEAAAFALAAEAAAAVIALAIAIGLAHHRRRTFFQLLDAN
ncbi:MAG: hypothetical protein KGM94_03360, partial [Bradyrhizobium sp.]|nr:hypothetical protein [Bradyrhizobium sp.]